MEITLFKWDHFSNRNSFGRPSVKTICNNPCYTAALLIAGPAEFKDTAGVDRGWLLPTDPHDPTRRTSVADDDPLGQPPLNEPPIYRTAACRGTVSKTVGNQISVDPPRCPPAAKAFCILERRRARGIFSRSRALTDVWTSCTSRSVFRGCRRGDETERARTNKHTATACKLARTRRQIRWPNPAGRYKLK
ncbi:hypothetical protein T12_1255 [Trichinella patagoniensis]|uniref:Uncharacterized protein n=1 Tax=Trichinella patagoniensis TaxID=990121 RepID=A0A0V0Z5C0_9BILA|nr:hypothetical protein T12_1255 [Trichinella patagoniensis]